ncbi:MAG: hypothetical protein KIT83_10225 [Bryobacterales bacterium]|nr:hypothetical protein [Bryobacterales bacterium]
MARFAFTLTLISALAFLPVTLSSQGVPLESILRDGVRKEPSGSAPSGQQKADTAPVAAPQKPQARQPAIVPRQAGPAGTRSAAGEKLPFSMQLAAGWQASLTPESGVLARSPDGKSVVAILPVMNLGSQPPGDWLRRNGARVLSRYLPEATVSALYPSKLGANGVLVSLSYNPGGGPGRSNALLFAHGDVGTLYIVGAPAQVFERQRPAMLAMLRSFSFRGEPLASGQARQTVAEVQELRYRKHRDPNEGAFTLDVPANWTVEGGTVRRSEVDLNTYIKATSPEGLVVMLGDEYIPKFTTPNPTFEMAGLREGSQYSPFPGNVMIVQRYLPGPVYAQYHAGQFIRKMGIANAQIGQPKERPELNQKIAAIGVTTTAGEVQFRGARGTQQCEGYVLAATSIMVMPGQDSGMWNVQSLVSYIAPAGKSATARAVVARMLSSIQMNPQWVAQQRQSSSNTYRAVKETNEYISNLFRETREQQQRVQDRQNREFGDYIRGVVRLRDTETGEVLEGRAGNNYYWRIRHTDTLVGSDISSPPPNIDLTEMEQVR